MGRHFEVRAAAMAKTAAAKAKVYSRYSKEILVAAKSGVPDPDMNQPLKKAIARAKANSVPTDVIKRAIDKAKSSADESFSEARYEGFGLGAGSTVIIDCYNRQSKPYNRKLTCLLQQISLQNGC